MRLVQLKSGHTRRLALVEEPNLRLLSNFDSLYALASEAIQSGQQLTALAEKCLSNEVLAYDPIYNGKCDWQLLVPIDHPEDPARCHVSGTGLTHLGSASDRAAMHERSEQELTDSMKMFRWGVEAGRPSHNAVGIAPEWFYKGNGAELRAHGQPLVTPSHAEDGGEEAEIAVLYIIGPGGSPFRVGMATGNEFSDHRFEKRNYLNLAGSKLRTSSIGPEICIGAKFDSVPGKVAIIRNGHELWSKQIATGENEMCHSLRNLEHHHFKFALHRRPGDLHVHFLGAHSLSFGQGIELADGDTMQVQFDGFGRALQNPVHVEAKSHVPIEVYPLA